MDDTKIWDYRDILFLIIFPVLQLICVVVVIFCTPFLAHFWKLFIGMIGEKFYLGGILLVSLTLFYLIGILAPSKSVQEKSNREKYSALIHGGDLLLSKKKIDEAYQESTFLLKSRLAQKSENIDF